MPGVVPEAVKEERYARFMKKTAAISIARVRIEDADEHDLYRVPLSA